MSLPLKFITMKSRWSSEIPDFQSTFCLEKVDFPCMKSDQEILECFQKHSRLIPWSKEMLLHTHKVTVWCLQLNIRNPFVNWQNQWIPEDLQKFLTFSQLFVMKKWIFLAWILLRKCSDVFKNSLGLFIEVRRWFYIPTKSPYDVYKSI